jgi:acetyl esterase/lipase
MQSWQTDFVNLSLSLGMKKSFRHISSLKHLRTVMGFVDGTLGRLSLPRNALREKVEIPTAEFDAEWINCSGADNRRVILYLPGGAFVLRFPNLHTAMLSRICQQADACGLMTYYRLAPEHPFPACLEDSLLAYQWLLDQGISSDRIAIAGDSAGGGLTLSTLLAIRDRGMPVPACGYMLSPLLDTTDMAPSRWKNASTDTALPPPGKRALNPRPMYVGSADPEDPLVSPIRGDYQGLPPLYVQVSDSEMLLDDSLRLARRCQIYNVYAKVDIWRKTPHVWQLFPFLPESRQAIEKAGAFLQNHIPQDD